MKHFGDPDLIETAHWELAALQQISPASTYVACFQEITVRCKHSDYDIHRCFIKGLKCDIQFLMLHNCPEKLEELYQLTIELDGLVYQMNRSEEEFLGSSKGRKPFNSFNNFPCPFQNQNPGNSASTSIPGVKSKHHDADIHSILTPDGKVTPEE